MKMSVIFTTRGTILHQSEIQAYLMSLDSICGVMLLLSVVVFDTVIFDPLFNDDLGLLSNDAFISPELTSFTIDFFKYTGFGGIFGFF